MKNSYLSGGSICRLLTLLLIVLGVGSAAYQVNGAPVGVPLKGVDPNKLFDKVFGNKPDEIIDKSLVGFSPNIRHLLLFNLCSDRLVQLIHTKRHGVRAKGKHGKKMEFSRLIIESTPRNTLVISGKDTRYYLCFSKRGKLIIRRNRKPGCEFREQYSADKNYTQFFSVNTRQTWRIGFDERGKALRGNPRKVISQKCYNFLKIEEHVTTECKSVVGPSGVNFCDNSILNMFKPKNLKTVKSKRRNKLRHNKHHKRRRKDG